MIYLKDLNVLFIKTAKVGGTSFEIALSKFAGDDCVITPIVDYDEEKRKSLGFRGPQNYNYKVSELGGLTRQQITKAASRFSMPMKYYNHIPARTIKKRMDTSTWDNCLKVSIVRNPFEFAVSDYYFQMDTEKKRQSTSFDDFISLNPSTLTTNKKITHIDGKNCLDFEIRYDRLDADIGALEQRIPRLQGLNDVFKSIKAKAKFRDRSKTLEDMYRDAPRAFRIVNAVCKEDIEFYGFDVPTV